MSKLLWLLPLLALVFPAAPAQNNHTQLQVVSSTLDASTHAITVSLVNRSPKNIVAYVLKLEQFDPSGKLIGLPLTVGEDHVFMLFYGPNHWAIISPGADLVKQFISAPTAVTANASVVALAYEDRTAGGDPNEVALLFKNRVMHAQHAQAAADLLANYPAKPVEAQARLSKLNAIHERTGATERLLHDSGNAARNSSTPSVIPSEQRWQAAATEQRSLANFLMIQSREVTK